MNKEKLIGMIIKKETYKDTKPVQGDILRKKQEAVNVSIAAINQILKDDYNAQAKLYAVRYLKDCFEKGNEQFIAKVESKILPILVKMVKDSESETEIVKYAGSYTRSADLQQFKSIVSSLFTMSRECIQKWATWIPSPSRQFITAQRDVAKLKKNPWHQGFSYFRQENQTLFKENCEKNGFIIKNDQKLAAPKQQLQKQQKINRVQQKQHQQSNLPSQLELAKEKYRSMSKITAILDHTRSKIKLNQVFRDKQMSENEAKFNAAVNQYIEEASQFDEHYLENKIDEFQKLKNDNLKIQEEIIKSQSVFQQTKNQIKKQKNKQDVKVQVSTQKIGKQQQNVDPSKAANSQSLAINKKQESVQSKVNQNNRNENNSKMTMQTTQTPKIVVIAPKTNEVESKIKINDNNKQKQMIKPNCISNKKQAKSNIAQESNKNEIIQERVNFQQSDSEDMIESLKNVKQQKGKPNSQKSQKNTAKFLTEQQFTLTAPETKANDMKKQQRSNGSSIAQIQPMRSFQEVLNINNSGIKHEKEHSIKQKSPLVSNMSLQQPSSTMPMQKVVYPNNTDSNKYKQEYLNRATKNYEVETSILQNKIANLQKQIEVMRRKQTQSVIAATSRVDFRELDFLKKKLENQQALKLKMQQEIVQLRQQIKTANANFAKSKQQQWNTNENQFINKVNSNLSPQQSDISKSSYKLKKISPKINTDDDLSDKFSVSRSRVQPNILPIQQPVNVNGFSARIDEDYNNNLTHFQKISSWLNEKNQILFRLCVLGASEQFYQSQSMSLYKMQHLFTENDASFLKMTISMHFNRLQPSAPRVSYKNIAEVDFWTKPINGIDRVFSQETIGRLCLVPMKIMKSTVYFDENTHNCTFLMPFLFYSFLQPQDFDSEQFGSIIDLKHNQVVKSKIFYLDKNIAHTAIDLSKILKNSILSNQYLEMCLRQETEDKVYMVQIELLKNQRAVVRILPIPYNSQMLLKAKELVGNLTFLLSSSSD